MGKRSNIRTEIPVTLKTDTLNQPIAHLQAKEQQRTALIALLARNFGLRFREASLLNSKQALKTAKHLGKINITEGTKGGRGKDVDRWVPVNTQQLKLLEQAAQLQGKANNLIPRDLSFIDWRNKTYNQWRAENKSKVTVIKGFHDMRAAYACEHYHAITGCPAPLIAGKRLVEKALDLHARGIIAQELGHDRTDFAVSYIGSSK